MVGVQPSGRRCWSRGHRERQQYWSRVRRGSGARDCWQQSLTTLMRMPYFRLSTLGFCCWFCRKLVCCTESRKIQNNVFRGKRGEVFLRAKCNHVILTGSRLKNSTLLIKGETYTKAVTLHILSSYWWTYSMSSRN